MMTNTLLRAGALACALMTSTCLTPAHAEERLINTPAERFATAPGGVDMRTGRYVYSETDLAIGGEGDAGLALTRILTADVPGHANPFANFSHNWDIMVSEARVNLDNPVQSGVDYRVFVHFGGRSQTFQSRSNMTAFETASQAWGTLTYSGGSRDSATVVYTFTAQDGTIATFRPLGGGDCSHERRCAYVSEIVAPDGTHYTFDYGSTGGATGGAVRLWRVISSRGYALMLEGSGHFVGTACVVNLATAVAPTGVCPATAQATASYGYVALPSAFGTRLAGVTRPDGSVAGFTYADRTNGSTALLDMGFVRPGDSTPWLVNTLYHWLDEQWVPQEIVDRQDFADGRSYVYSFESGPSVGGQPGAIAGGTYTNALGQMVLILHDWPIAPGSNTPGSPCLQWPCTLPNPIPDEPNITYQQTPGPVEITDELGRTTTLDYCHPAAMAGLPPAEKNRCIVIELQTFTDPEGLRTDLEWDGHRNITRVTRHPRGGVGQPIVTSAVYDVFHPKSSAKPLSVTDANGNTTEYTYAPEHGGVLTETGPAPTPGAPRPQTRHEYVQRHARISDGAGGHVAAATPVWLLAATSFCRTSAATGNPAAPCATAGDEVRTVFDYGPDSGPNNLLLRGQTVTTTDNGVATTLRTCFGYDALGRRISETRPNAELASCP